MSWYSLTHLSKSGNAVVLVTERARFAPRPAIAPCSRKAASISSSVLTAKTSICRPMVATAAFAFAVCNATQGAMCYGVADGVVWPGRMARAYR